MRLVNKDPRRTRLYPFLDLSFAHEGVVLAKVSAISLLKVFKVHEKTCLVKA